jgi:zinc transporter ZupT
MLYLDVVPHVFQTSGLHMTQDETRKSDKHKNTGNSLPFGIGGGIAIGAGLGAAMHNMGAGIAIGVALGVALGLSFSKAKRR